MSEPHPRLGALPRAAGGVEFTVWAPHVEAVSVLFETGEEHPLTLVGGGYFQGVVEGAKPADLYRYRLGQELERPDPASRHQPQGVHGPSVIVDRGSFAWTDDAWCGLRLPDLVICEIHVGTFSREGTFEGAIEKLDELEDLGITAVELMPLGQFPGERNWGYDGVDLFAVQHSYGGPDGLRRFVDACHARGLAVLLDVVYNHLGPEGNYLRDFGPYFTSDYATPWGDALNFAGPDSDAVRHFFFENARHWLEEYHVDGFRLDAVHAIVDPSARPFLAELTEHVHDIGDRLGRRVHVIAESDRNDPRFVRPLELGGYDMDAQWADDFHHALHALLEPKREGYFQDYGRVEHLARAWRDGFTYAGDYSEFRRRRYGAPATDLRPCTFVVCSQNHDQIGNRLLGDRPAERRSRDALALGAAAVLLSPHLPLLFMGEEYGEKHPFPYFVSHGDPSLVEAVRKGRREEFASFAWQGEPPDPQAEATFESARLTEEVDRDDGQRAMRALYGELLRIRRAWNPAERNRDEVDVCWSESPRWLRVVHRARAGEQVLLFHFDSESHRVELPWPTGRWRRVLDTSAKECGGPGERSPKILDSTGTVAFEMGGPMALAMLRSE
ncbi:MAG: malto-oligosyltrehalose trehalohydrolase [Planctomycetota bacterium]